MSVFNILIMIEEPVTLDHCFVKQPEAVKQLGVAVVINNLVNHRLNISVILAALYWNSFTINVSLRAAFVKHIAQVVLCHPLVVHRGNM